MGGVKFLFEQKIMHLNLDTLIFNPNLVILLMKTRHKLLKPSFVLESMTTPYKQEQCSIQTNIVTVSIINNNNDNILNNKLNEY